MSLAKNHRVLIGEVVGVRNSKTIAVKVERKVMHPIYQKLIKKAKRYQVHDEKSLAALNDTVEIVECRPISKTKHFRLKTILNTPLAQQQVEEVKKAKLAKDNPRTKWIETHGLYYAYRFKSILAKAKAGGANPLTISGFLEGEVQKRDKKAPKERLSRRRAAKDKPESTTKTIKNLLLKAMGASTKRKTKKAMNKTTKTKVVKEKGAQKTKKANTEEKN